MNANALMSRTCYQYTNRSAISVSKVLNKWNMKITLNYVNKDKNFTIKKVRLMNDALSSRSIP